MPFALILQYLPYLFQAAQEIPQILDFIKKIRSNLQQDKQWTPEAEQIFTQGLQDLEDNPPDWAKPDAA